MQKAEFLPWSQVAALLGGFGLWQFGALGLGEGDGEREHEHGEEEYARMPGQLEGDTGAGNTAAGVLARYGGSILEVEREHEYGRELFEVKLVDGEGRRREVMVDADGNELEVRRN